MTTKKKIKYIILTLLIIIFSVSIVGKTFSDGDVFFGIAVGNKILDEGFYEEETFTWHEGLKYQNVRWIFDITLATIYNHFDFNGIYVFTMIMTAIYGVTIFYMLIKQKNNENIAFAVTLIIMYCAKNVFYARAQIFSFLIFIFEFYFIEKLLQTGKKRYTAILFALSVLLANTHASVYPLYFLFYMPYIAEFILYKLHIRSNENSKIIITKNENMKSLFTTLIITAFGGFISPLGFAPYVNMFRTVGALSSDVISEMQPITPVYYVEFSCLAIAIVAIVGFTKVKIRASDGMFLVGFFLLSLSTNRSSYFFIFASAFILARLISEIDKEYEISKIKINKHIKNAICVAVPVILLAFSVGNLVEETTQECVSEQFAPVSAADYILENCDLETMKLYNGFNYGAYLEFRGIPVFMDSRVEIYLSSFNDTTIFADWLKISSYYEYETLFDEYGVTHALLYYSDNLYKLLDADPEWELIYQDANFLLYEKVN